MIRAYLYLAAAGVIWFVEGFLFTRYLPLGAWQLVLLGFIYCALFGAAVLLLLRSTHRDIRTPGFAAWRAVSLAPMFVVIVGSFVSLPLILLVAALGKI